MSQREMLDNITRGTKAAGLGAKLDEIITLINQMSAWKNCSLSAAGLVIGSVSAAKVKIANTVNYVINGAFKSISTQEVAFTATTHDIPANASAVQEAVYVLTVALNGTVSITMGLIATGSGKALVPDALPANQAVIGQVRIAVAAGATSFTAATTLLNNGALTVTYTDLESLPITAPNVDVLV